MSSRIARLVFGPLPRYGGEIAETCAPALPEPSPATALFAHLPLRLLSDEHVAAQLQAGRADALTVLFERHSARLFGIARRILRNDAEAEDTVQTIFLDAYRSIDQFDPAKGQFKTWLMLFAYQRAFNRKRHLLASRFFVTDSLHSLAEIAYLSEPPTACSRTACSRAAFSREESRILIQQVLRGLAPRQRRIIELIYGEGLTAEEAAARTGETVRVVRHNLYRGLEKLRRQLFDVQEPAPRKGAPR